MTATSSEAQTRRLLVIILLLQGPFVLWSLASNPAGLFRYLGFAQGASGTTAAWLLATLIVIAYVWSASTISVVRQHMFRWSALKLFAVLAAVAAGVLEEVVFRKWIMDILHDKGYGPFVQVLASGVSFGIVHLVWGAKSLAAGINAMLSTSALGIGLALVYLVGERSLAPCIAAHFAITAIIEPGLILAAVTNKLGYWNERRQPHA